VIEHSHLKIIHALNENGTLTKAANALCLSQSALSHQIRYLEKKLAVTLWQREGRNLRLTQAGKLLLQTAVQVLPVLEQAERSLIAYGEGRLGILRIGVECYPCYEWLTKVIGIYLQKMPEVDIDIVNKFQFTGLEGLLNHHIDVLVTPDIERKEKIDYVALTEYELVLLTAARHPLSKKKVIMPANFSSETLLTFPVAVERLDIFTQFLTPAFIMPSSIKKIESIDLMLQMVSLGRGICVLPEWVASKYMDKIKLCKFKIGRQGIYKKLFVALRKQDRNISYIEEFIAVGKQSANKLLNIDS
jgi:LysR family transcriptional regulator for metE and metH